MNAIKNILSARYFLLFVMFVKLIQVPLTWNNPFIRAFFQVFPYICVLWFIAILMSDFFDHRSLWRNTGTLWILLFLVSYVITTVINYQYHFIDNLQLVFWMALQYIVLYNCDRNRDVGYHRQTLEMAAKVFIATTIVMDILSFGMFFLGIGGEIMVDGMPMRFGFRSRRLFGAFSSPNYAALFSVIAMIALLYFFQKTRKKYQKIICVVLGVLEYYYLILSVSTTGKISLMIAAFLVCFGILYSRMKKISAVKTVGGIVLSCIVAVVLVLPFAPVQTFSANLAQKVSVNSYAQSIKKPVEKLLSSPKAERMDSSSSDSAVSTTVPPSVTEEAPSSVPPTSESQENEGKNVVINEMDDEDFSLERGDFASNLPKARLLTHDRLPIWQDAVKLLFPLQPLFGVSSLGYMQIINEQFPSSFIAEYNKYSMHNDFVTLLVCCGIVGFVLMMIFIVIVISKIIAYLIANRSSIENLKKIWYPLTIVVILGVSMMYSDAVIVNMAAQSVVFWACLGYIMAVVDPHPKETLVSKIVDRLAKPLKDRNKR